MSSHTPYTTSQVHLHAIVMANQEVLDFMAQQAAKSTGPRNEEKACNMAYPGFEGSSPLIIAGATPLGRPKLPAGVVIIKNSPFLEAAALRKQALAAAASNEAKQ